MKVIVGMATMPGREKYCRLAIQSLMNNTVQPYDILLYDNGVEQIDLTDNGKFFGLSLYNEAVYYFSTDDDLFYPKDYIQRSIEAIDKYNCIITYHGRYLKGLGLDYYKDHRSFRCLGNEPREIQIDVAGTGCSAFRTDTFNPVGIHAAQDKRMSDLVFSLEAAKQKVKIMHIAHKNNWIKYLDVPIDQTIYGQYHKECTRQGQLADEIYRLNRIR